MKTWIKIPAKKVVDVTVEKMQARNFNVTVVQTKEDVLPALKELIPQGSEVMTGSSTTLAQSGVMDFLQSPDAYWNNVQGKVWSENDEEKRNTLRRKATTSDYFLASVNAFTEDGQLIAVDATGSRVTALPYAAKKVILVVGTHKLVKDIDEAMTRIKEYVFPLEDVRLQQAYGMHSSFGKWLIIDKEFDPSRLYVILVNDVVGY